MLTELSKLLETSICARGEPIGKVHDIYFDHIQWNLRYFVCQGLSKPKCVLTRHTRWDDKSTKNCRLDVSLTRRQVELSPDTDTKRPLSRKSERLLHDYYGLPYYWVTSREMIGATGEGRQEALSAAQHAEHEKGNRDHPERQPLMSARETNNYQVRFHDSDEALGTLVDFSIDTEDWSVQHLVVGILEGFADSPHFLLPPLLVHSVNWASTSILVSRETIKQAIAQRSFEKSRDQCEMQLCNVGASLEQWKDRLLGS